MSQRQEHTGQQQDTVAALRESMAQLQSGEQVSTLFAGLQQHQDAPGPGAAPAETPVTSTAGEKPAVTDRYAAARAVVLRKLTGSAKSRHQLAQVLEDKDFEPEIITAVLDRMEEVHLVDDAAFAHQWVRTRAESKNLGQTALRQELQKKGIDQQTIEQALEQLTVEDEQAAAEQLVEAKLSGVIVPDGWGPEARKEREKLTRRLVGMLGRRGHNPATAFRIVSRALEERAAA